MKEQVARLLEIRTFWAQCGLYNNMWSTIYIGDLISKDLFKEHLGMTFNLHWPYQNLKYLKRAYYRIKVLFKFCFVSRCQTQRNTFVIYKNNSIYSDCKTVVNNLFIYEQTQKVNIYCTVAYICKYLCICVEQI